MSLRKISAAFFTLAFLSVSGCNVHVNKEGGGDGQKNVTISTPFGGMHVKTDEVSPRDAGLQAYPGARLVPKHDKNDSKANVNIDTPWFGLKVVALKYESDDPMDKIWDFYKKDMSQYGRVLECKSGSPDMKIEAKNKEDLSCDKKGVHSKGPRSGDFDMGDTYQNELKAGGDGRYHVVAMKPSGKGTEFTLVYVVTRGNRESL